MSLDQIALDVMANRYRTRQRASERIATALESDIIPWSKNTTRKLARNISNQNLYEGINLWLLELTSIEKKFTSCWWGTIDEWNQHNVTITNQEGTEILADIPKCFVYNKDQVEVELAELELVLDHEEAQRIFDASGARVKPDVRPMYYRQNGIDWIGLPPKSWYKNENKFRCIQFHELVHWATYGIARLGWEGDLTTGELIAEFGSALLMDHCGLALTRTRADIAEEHYEKWIVSIRRRFDYVTKASLTASRATEYICTLSQPLQPHS